MRFLPSSPRLCRQSSASDILPRVSVFPKSDPESSLRLWHGGIHP